MRARKRRGVAGGGGEGVFCRLEDGPKWPLAGIPGPAPRPMLREASAAVILDYTQSGGVRDGGPDISHAGRATRRGVFGCMGRQRGRGYGRVPGVPRLVPVRGRGLPRSASNKTDWRPLQTTEHARLTGTAGFLAWAGSGNDPKLGPVPAASGNVAVAMLSRPRPPPGIAERSLCSPASLRHDNRWVASRGRVVMLVACRFGLCDLATRVRGTSTAAWGKGLAANIQQAGGRAWHKSAHSFFRLDIPDAGRAWCRWREYAYRLRSAGTVPAAGREWRAL